MLAESDTDTEWQADETDPFLAVNYTKLDRVPLFSEGWGSVVEAMQAGNFYGTTGELLSIATVFPGPVPRRVYTASLEWTFPLEFAELVWSDCKKGDRQIIPATDLPPFGSHEFKIPFDAAGKRWVRFAVWNSAGDRAYTQPVLANQPALSSQNR